MNNEINNLALDADFQLATWAVRMARAGSLRACCIAFVHDHGSLIRAQAPHGAPPVEG